MCKFHEAFHRYPQRGCVDERGRDELGLPERGLRRLQVGARVRAYSAVTLWSSLRQRCLRPDGGVSWARLFWFDGEIQRERQARTIKRRWWESIPLETCTIQRAVRSRPRSRGQGPRLSPVWKIALFTFCAQQNAAGRLSVRFCLQPTSSLFFFFATERRLVLLLRVVPSSCNSSGQRRQRCRNRRGAPHTHVAQNHLVFRAEAS